MINPTDNTTVNITLKVLNSNLVPLEKYLEANFNLIDFSVLIDTSKLYEEDDTFKKIVKDIKKLKNIKLDYINKHNR